MFSPKNCKSSYIVNHSKKIEKKKNKIKKDEIKTDEIKKNQINNKKNCCCIIN